MAAAAARGTQGIRGGRKIRGSEKLEEAKIGGNENWRKRKVALQYLCLPFSTTMAIISNI